MEQGVAETPLEGSEPVERAALDELVEAAAGQDLRLELGDGVQQDVDLAVGSRGEVLTLLEERGDQPLDLVLLARETPAVVPGDLGNPREEQVELVQAVLVAWGASR